MFLLDKEILTTPLHEISIFKASECMSFLKQLYEDDFTIHLHCKTSRLLQSDILHHTLDLQIDVTCHLQGSYETFQLNQSVGMALAEAIHSMLHSLVASYNPATGWTSWSTWRNCRNLF